MKTYNDFLKIKDNPDRLKAFILDAISEHKATEDYQTAEDAKLYMKTKNPTIINTNIEAAAIKRFPNTFFSHAADMLASKVDGV